MSDPLDVALGLLFASLRTALIVSFLPIGKKASAGRAFTLPFSLAVGLCMQSVAPVQVTPSGQWVLLGLKEIVLGAVLGFMVSRMFLVMGTAGALMDQQAGYTVGALFNPNMGRTAGPIETIYTLLLIYLLMTASGGFYFPKVIMATYAVWPITAFTPPMHSIQGFIDSALGSGLDQLVNMCMQVAMPMLAMLMFADMCVGMFSRYAPEFSPLSASMATKAFLVVLMLAVTLASQTQFLRRLILWLTRVQ
jgi:type III secretory pathway component EscT